MAIISALMIISYVAMEHGFMYLYAIIDVYNRCIVGWGLYNTLDAANAIEVLEQAVKAHRPGLPIHQQGMAGDLWRAWNPSQYGRPGTMPG